MKKNTILVLLLFSTVLTFAQVNISGVVKTAEEGQPLPGASIVEKGTTNGTVSGFDGDFSLDVTDSNSILLISYIGYATVEVIVGSQSHVDIQLQLDADALDEVVVVGYGSVKKANLTGSVSAVDFDDLQLAPVTNTASLMQGRMAGVSVSNFSTQPGKEEPNIVIRGNGTFNAGQAPLVIIDGIESSLGQIPPSDIKSISVLKDAASSSIYGVRAANGVILVTTKKGRSGKMRVDYNANFSVQQNLIKSNLLESFDFATITNAWLVADGNDPWYTPEALTAIQNNSNPDLYANTDWEKVAFRSAFVQSHNISISGGSDNVIYRVSSEYLDQEGILIGTGSNRFNLRSNIEAKLNDKFKIGLNLFGYKKHIDENLSASGGSDRDNGFPSGLNYLLRRSTLPTVPIRYSDGNFGFADGANSVIGSLSQNILFESLRGHNRADEFHAEGKAYVDWEIVEDLHLNSSASFSHETNDTNRFSPTFSKFDVNGDVLQAQVLNGLNVSNRKEFRYQIDNVLTYAKSLNKHSFNLLLGQSAQYFRSDFSSASIQDFPNDEIFVLGGGVTNPRVNGTAFENSLSSLFGRVNYNYNDTYLFEFNLRRDGSSRMPEANRFAVFPSFSAGWVLSNENFLKQNDNISLLKLRGSWGQLGNQEIGNYAYQQGISTGLNYVIDGQLVGGAGVTALANASVSWETTTITDIGLDLNLFNGKLGFVFDWFNKTSTDVLLRLPIPATLGVSSAPFQNVGEVQNIGWEFAVQYRNRLGKVNVFANANISSVKNKIKDLGNRENFIEAQFINQIDSPIFSLYGLVSDGFFTENDFNTDGSLNTSINPSQYGNDLQPGDIKYKDISGPDGVPDGKISEDHDRQIVGNPYADLNYSFTLGGDYNGFDVSLFFQGVSGIDRWQWYNNELGGNFTTAILDHWTPTNTDASFPRLGNAVNNNKNSSFWVKDASYLRLKNLEIGYTLPKSIVDKIKISKARVYFSGANLFTITDVVDYDPERRIKDIRATSYPQAKIYSLGLNLSL